MNKKLETLLKNHKQDETLSVNRCFGQHRATTFQIKTRKFIAEVENNSMRAWELGWLFATKKIPELKESVELCRQNYIVRVTDGMCDESKFHILKFNPEFYTRSSYLDVENLLTNDQELIEQFEAACEKQFTLPAYEFLSKTEDFYKGVKGAIRAYSIDLDKIPKFTKGKLENACLFDEMSNLDHCLDWDQIRELEAKYLVEPVYSIDKTGQHYHHEAWYDEQAKIQATNYNEAVDSINKSREVFPVEPTHGDTPFSDYPIFEWFASLGRTNFDYIDTKAEYLTHLGYDVNVHKLDGVDLKSWGYALAQAVKYVRKEKPETAPVEKKKRDSFEAIEIEEKDGLVFCDVSEINQKDYKNVASKLEGIQGKWNRKAGGFVFKQGIEETRDLLKRAQAGENINIERAYKKRTNFFASTKIVADRVHDLVNAHVEFTPDIKALEPSCGKADLIKPLMGYVNFDVCEFEDDMREDLEKVEGITVVGSDFLKYQPKCSYDLIVANPPFSNKRDLIHVQHMMSMLADGGVIVSVVGGGFDKKYESWIDEIKSQGFSFDSEDVEAGAFKESGTNVATQIITIRKG